MSMENAILELAAAMREQAAAQRESNEVQRATAAGYERAVTAYATGEQRKDVAQANEQVSAKMAGDKPEVKDAEIEKAVQKVEADAKKEGAATSAATSQESTDDSSDALVELDYTKDVRPVLLAVNKKAGQPELKALLTKFGAATGDKLKPEQYGEVLAAANKILAG